MSNVKRRLEEQVADETRLQAAATSPDFARLIERPMTTLKFDPGERKLVLDTCCGGASQKEAEQLIAIAEARGLNPLTGECHFVKRWDSQKRHDVWSVQASIDAFRIKAEESGLYDGQDEPEYEYEKDGSIKLARVRVYRKDWTRPAVGVARYSEYVQKTKDGDATRFWKQMPHNQLSKCAEALAFRKAFPRRLAKVYTDAEMAQASNDNGHDTVPRETTVDLDKWRGLIADAPTLEELKAVKEMARKAGPAVYNPLRGQIQERKAELEAPPPREPGDDVEEYEQHPEAP